MTLRAPVEGMHAVATGLGGAGDQVGPKRSAAGQYRGLAERSGDPGSPRATGAATGALMDRVASNAAKVTSAATGYQNTDQAGANAVEAVRPS
jgi:hypothetical protein